MSRGIRVCFEPRIEDVLGFRTVLRSGIALLHRGAGTSRAVLNTFKPANLVFHATFWTRSRFLEIGAEISFDVAFESSLDVPLGPVEVLHTTMPLEQLAGGSSSATRGRP